MPFLTLSPRTRRALVALALLVPVTSAAALAGGALWVRGHGGLAASLTLLARQAALVIGRADGVPAAMAATEALALDPHLPTTGWICVAGGDRDGRGPSFALIEPGKGATSCFDVEADSRSGSLRRLERSAGEPMLWFADDGAEYVVTDPATVARARELCAPLESIGREMGEVGARLGEVGAKLGRFGGRLGALGGRMGGLSARLATEDMSRAERERARAELEQVRAEMEQVRAEMEQVNDGAGSEHEELSRRMSELSRRHKATLARMRADMRRLLDEARANGKAEKLGGSI